MEKPLTYKQAKRKYLKTLEQYVPIVARVHGDNHPEFHDVHDLFDTVSQKIKAAGPDKPELEDEFTRLRAITGNYTVPGDVCESYEAVYTMLAELDRAYHA
ncbi:MAG: iron-sulfur cluster repair di-iron protein, ric [Eubacteriales bacterium]|nr:iron-sulfur cluster repair di-iron protein, ric [Eubacteriales bacterium]